MKQHMTVISSFISICYYICWAIIFIIYTNDNYATECHTLIQWDRALITVLLFISAINLFTSLITYLFGHKNLYLCSGISVCKSCLNYIAGIWLMIGIINAYCNIDSTIYCKSLMQANLAYILIEISIVGNCCFFVFAMCLITQYTKRIKAKIEQSEEDDNNSDEENEI